MQVKAKRLRDFMKYAQGKGVEHVADVTGSIIFAFQKHLACSNDARGNLNSVNGRNKYVTVVKGFFRHLKHEGYIAHNPADDVEYAREAKKLPRAILTTKEVKKLLRQPDTQSVLGFRDRTILEVFYTTGIRRQELLQLTIEDIDLDSGLIVIREGKGKKDRVVPVGKIACRYLESYINGIRPELARPDPGSRVLFLSRVGRQMDPSTVKHLISKYAKAAGIPHSVTPHTFRHTCATHMIRNRANIRHVQELLGHNQLTTTQQYVRVTITDLQEAHKRHHPREKDK
jgi:integrase/recombinase XerD